jgi:formyltetrahydrofolate synthetase
MTKRSDIKEIARPENGTSSSRIQSVTLLVQGIQNIQKEVRVLRTFTLDPVIYLNGYNPCKIGENQLLKSTAFSLSP